MLSKVFVDTLLEVLDLFVKLKILPTNLMGPEEIYGILDICPRSFRHCSEMSSTPILSMSMRQERNVNTNASKDCSNWQERLCTEVEG